MYRDFAAYEGAARFEACALLPANTIDGLGNDRGDYTTLLAFEAAGAARLFRERHGFCEPAERRYVKAALRKRRIIYYRKQRRHTELFGVPFEAAPHPVLQIDGELEARDAIRRLAAELTDDDFQFLVRVGLSDGKLTSAVNEKERRTAANRLKRLRQRALAILRDFVFQK